MTSRPGTLRRPEVHLVDSPAGRIAALDWGGSGVPLVMLHPNGLCGGVYEPLAVRLQPGEARPIAIDLPGHGQSDRPRGPAGMDFRTMARAVLAVLDYFGVRRAVGVGGSLGGGVAVLVDDERPGLWERLLLAEPVAFPPSTSPPPGRNPMAEGARRRRATFDDIESIVRAYSRRPPLAQLAPEALESYVRWGTEPTATGVTLRCRPEDEATVFERSAQPQNAPSAWAHLECLTAPTTILAGRSSFLPDVFEAQAARCRGRLVVVEGGHFALHEDTERGTSLLRRHALAYVGLDAD